jgi:hypothetical protein
MIDPIKYLCNKVSFLNLNSFLFYCLFSTSFLFVQQSSYDEAINEIEAIKKTRKAHKYVLKYRK